MNGICPECGAIIEYNAYYGRMTCTRCKWESGRIIMRYIVKDGVTKKVSVRQGCEPYE